MTIQQRFAVCVAGTRAAGRKRAVLCVAVLFLVLPARSPPATAAIYRWDNGALITTQSPHSNADFEDAMLAFADLADALLDRSEFESADLTSAHLMRADLTNASLDGANLTGADLTGALVRGADLGGSRLTVAQLSSTATYQSGDLTEIGLSDNDLTAADFAGMTLERADFRRAKLDNADFTGALVRGAYFGDTTRQGFTAAQFYATASYQTGDLTGIGLSDNDLSGWDLAGKNLTRASFSDSSLLGADLSGAVVDRADFAGASHFTAGQFYATATYRNGDLTGMVFGAWWTNQSSDLSGWDFAGKNLTDAWFDNVTLANTDFRGATIRGANFSGTTNRGFTPEQFYQTASYQDGDLGRIVMKGNDLSGWDFAGKRLADADFDSVTGSNASFQGAGLAGARFRQARLLSADFSGADLTDTLFVDATLTDADFRSADLTSALLANATLTDADFSGAVVRRASLWGTTSRGFTPAQLYSTGSYQNRDLTGVQLSGNDLAGWDFSDQDLSYADFRQASLTSTDFSGAILRGAILSGATQRGFTAAQLYATASYQNGDLSQIQFADRDDLSGWDFSGKNLTGANLSRAQLAGTDFTGAMVRGADFSAALGFTAEQLYATASYQNGDLREIEFGGIRGWDLSRQDLTGASFKKAWLPDVDFTGAVIRGADFRETVGSGFTAEQLYATASYRSGDLSWVALPLNDLSGWDFSGQDLTGAQFWNSLLAGTDFTGAVIARASFAETTAGGFTAAQLYGTASYQAGELAGISLQSNDLTSWNFSGQNLADADFSRAILISADLSFADLRGAGISAGQTRTAASTRNAILPDGRIDGLVLEAGERLRVHDDHQKYPGNSYFEDSIIAVTVEKMMRLDAGATLNLIFADSQWESTISFQPETTVALGGTLELSFADDTDPAGLVGSVFDLFDWGGASISGQFDSIVTPPQTVWDTSNVYTTGQVTLLWAVPEPSTLVLCWVGSFLVCLIVRFG